MKQGDALARPLAIVDIKAPLDFAEASHADRNEDLLSRRSEVFMQRRIDQIRRSGFKGAHPHFREKLSAFDIIGRRQEFDIQLLAISCYGVMVLMAQLKAPDH